RGEKQDRCGIAVFASLAEKLEAAFSGQPDIQHHQVVVVASEHELGFLRRLDPIECNTFFGEPLAQITRQALFVLDHHQTQRLHAHNAGTRPAAVKAGWTSGGSRLQTRSLRPRAALPPRWYPDLSRHCAESPDPAFHKRARRWCPSPLPWPRYAAAPRRL